MKFVTTLLLAMSLSLAGSISHSFAGDTDPLFINMTTDGVHRARMALVFGQNQQERGHPLTLFLNDRGVLVGSKAQSAKFAEHQRVLTTLISKGAFVIACPMCMKEYGVKESDLLPGIKVGSPEVVGSALFKNDTKSLTW
ncbi:MAG TPA: DsrE family protein [Terriglobales bacterium]|jgi:sulfur relay (sulfurtransferase) complex TusBCD TusD component (DsrE family)|nr:DsrE family protein [Terriglobales bacterium]